MLFCILSLLVVAVILNHAYEVNPAAVIGVLSALEGNQDVPCTLQKGGGAPPPPKPQKMPDIPPPPAAPAPLPPPPTQTAVAADQAAQDMMKQQLQRKGINSTLLAGETGGVNPQGKKSLLG